MPEIVFVSREVHPITRGGIGTHIHAVASALAPVANVVVVTPTLNEERYRELVRDRDPELPAGVRFEFVHDPAPEEVGSFYSLMHAYSALVYDKLRELYPHCGPDLIEFSDYLGEGLVTLQAKRTLDPALRDTRVCVRTHTTNELAHVLNGHADDHLGTRALFEGERYSLANADRVIWQGGDILGTYLRFYGKGAIAEPVRIRNAASAVAGTDATGTPPPADGPVKLLFVGRLERRKGVQNLLRAITARRADDWRLTLVGGDSPTAPLGSSMREQLELMAAEDPRIEFIDGRPRRELAELYADHHVLLCPSLWECWPNVVLEALHAGRPAIGTRTGGLVEMLGDPRAGWLVPGRDALALSEMLEERLNEREQIDELIASGGPRQVFDELTDEDVLRKSYLELAGSASEAHARSNGAPRAEPAAGEPPLVSVVVPYFRLHDFVADTVRSIFAQDYPRLEVIVVNDGSLWHEDIRLAELASEYPIRVLTKMNSGLGAARNAGILQSRGKYVLPLDADNMVKPDFVRRCVAVLEEDPEVPYVATWSRYIDEDGAEYEGPHGGYWPIGNSPKLVMDENVAGDGTAVIRRRVFELGHWYSTDLTSYEDWQLYRELHEAGMYGRVIPEPLLLYRVRRESMLREVGLPHHERLLREMNAHLIERRIEWESKKG